VADFCKFGYEHSGSIKAGNFFTSWGCISFTRKFTIQRVRLVTDKKRKILTH